MFYQKYVFGDVALHYSETDVAGEKSVGLTVLPASREFDAAAFPPDPLVQVAFKGDRSLLDYGRGISMRNREATLLRVTKQTADSRGVQTVLTDGKGNYYTHTLTYDQETGVFAAEVLYENKSGKTRTLEFLESAHISIAPQAGADQLILYRMTSAWSRECRLKKDEFYKLGLERSWGNYGLKSEKWGSVGSMPNRGYYPFAAVEDIDGFIWGLTIEAPYSWQLEVSLERESVALGGGLADYEWGHWRKDIKDGEQFSTDKAYFTLKQGGVNAVANAFVHYADVRLQVPQSEESMPVLFNEYCTTWGVPSQENIEKILSALEGLPIETFVIDAGWFKPDGVDWSLAGGDWQASKSLFPDGIKAIADKIRSYGKIPGIWFEFEVAAKNSELYKKEELLLKRDGEIILGKNRRFLDLRKSEADEYLKDRVLNFLKQNGFGYLKIDYNDAYGIGCDGAESLGEGGRQVAEESIKWLDKLKEVEGIVLENCSSGGSRIEPKRMSKVAMCSFSDAHECAEIPLVAANVSRVVPARQSQIWAVLRENESASRTIYSLCAAFMGRVCLSGDVIHMSDEKRTLLLNGLNFYSAVKDIVRHGDIIDIDCDVTSYRNPVGRQIYVKEYNGRRLVILHVFGKDGLVEIPLDGFQLDCAYTDLDYLEEDGTLQVPVKSFTAAAFLLEKRKTQ